MGYVNARNKEDWEIRRALSDEIRVAAALTPKEPQSDANIGRSDPAAPLREAAIGVLDSWERGDIDNDYDRFAASYDALRAALAQPKEADR